MLTTTISHFKDIDAEREMTEASDCAPLEVSGSDRAF